MLGDALQILGRLLAKTRPTQLPGPQDESWQCPICDHTFVSRQDFKTERGHSAFCAYLAGLNLLELTEED